MPELIDPNIGADGGQIDHRMNERAGIIGTILFLERLTREGGLAPGMRKEARHQADFLRALVRRRSRDGKDTFDGLIRESIEAMMIEHAKKQLQAPRGPELLTLDAEP